MNDPHLDVVTGAFGFTGRHIAERLLGAGHRVRTLTNHPRQDHPLAGHVEVASLNFAHLPALIASLEGATTLYNTYWIRFPHGGMSYERAIGQSRQLFQAAREAGVERIVHVSVSNPSPSSPLPYFRGKAQVEKALADLGVSYAILRPTVLFGAGAILLNNLAWLLRRSPVFLMPGDGAYRLQPIAVEDVADLAVRAGEGRENIILEAGGPETFSFEELLQIIASLVGTAVAFVHVPPGLALLASRALGPLVRDVVLTPEEMEGLRAGLLVSSGRPAGERLLTDWLAQHRTELGRTWFSELARHYQARKKPSAGG